MCTAKDVETLKRERYFAAPFSQVGNEYLLCSFWRRENVPETTYAFASKFAEWWKYLSCFRYVLIIHWGWLESVMVCAWTSLLGTEVSCLGAVVCETYCACRLAQLWNIPDGRVDCRVEKYKLLMFFEALQLSRISAGCISRIATMMCGGVITLTISRLAVNKAVQFGDLSSVDPSLAGLMPASAFWSYVEFISGLHSLATLDIQMIDTVIRTPFWSISV